MKSGISCGRVSARSLSRALARDPPLPISAWCGTGSGEAADGKRKKQTLTLPVIPRRPHAVKTEWRRLNEVGLASSSSEEGEGEGEEGAELA